MLKTFINLGIGFTFNFFIISIIKKLVNLSVKKGLTLEKVEKRNNLDLYYLFNCSILSVYSLYSLYYDNYEFLNYIKYYNLAYLINDIYRMFTIEECKKDNKIFAFHHIIFIIGWLFYADQFKFLYSKLLLAELNLITYNLRFIFINNNLKYHNILGILTYILFFKFRVYNFTYIYYLNYNDINLMLKVVFVSLIMLQYYWFTLITIKIYEIFMNKKDNKNIKLRKE